MSTGLIPQIEECWVSIHPSVPRIFLPHSSSPYPSRIFQSSWLKRLWKSSAARTLTEGNEKLHLYLPNQVEMRERGGVYRSWPLILAGSSYSEDKVNPQVCKTFMYKVSCRKKDTERLFLLMTTTVLISLTLLPFSWSNLKARFKNSYSNSPLSPSLIP
jgi:hypothetical protein